MNITRYRISKPTHGEQEWLSVRFWDEKKRKRVSASPAAAIYGLHPFVPQDKFAAELLGDTPPAPIAPTWAMTRGNDLEPLCIKWAIDRTGIEFDTPEEMFAADTDTAARMIATLDGFYEQGDDRKVLEIKTMSREWHGELPDYWRIQGVQQAICADVDLITWGVFDSTMSFHIYEQKVSDAEKQEHIDAVAKWLTAIDLGMTPDGVAWSYETISARYQKPVAEPIEVGPIFAEKVAQLKHVKKMAKDYSEMEDKLKAEVCEMMGPYEAATVDGKVLATWKGRTWQSLDIKALKAQEPDLAAKYSRPVTNRTLLLKGEKA
jgi:predicted phage-related endonuclease